MKTEAPQNEQKKWSTFIFNIIFLKASVMCTLSIIRFTQAPYLLFCLRLVIVMNVMIDVFKKHIIE